jgi:hypothetical protein
MIYKDILDRLETLANNHYFIEQFGYGNLSDIEVPDNEQPPKYPYMFINPVSINQDRRFITFNFNLIMMEQVEEDEDEEIKGQDACITYIQDIVSAFTNGSGNYLMDVVLPFNITVFKERFQDSVVGATANLTISYAKALDNCDPRIQ